VQTCPALRPRSCFRAIGLSALPLLPSALTHGVGFPSTFRISGLNHAACLLAVYASPRKSPSAVQHSLSAGGHLCRAGFGPAGPSAKGFRSVSTAFQASPFPKLSWRTRHGGCSSRLGSSNVMRGSSRPGRLLTPAPLKIRTCGTTASGSAGHGFAALRRNGRSSAAATRTVVAVARRTPTPWCCVANGG